MQERKMHRIFFKGSSENADTLRLTAAGIPVFLILSVLYGYLFTEKKSFLSSYSVKTAAEAFREEFYPVLLEQPDVTESVREEKRALSDVTSGGSGKISEQKGFHTLTPYDQLRISPGGDQGSQSAVEARSGRSRQYSHTAFTAAETETLPEKDGLLQRIVKTQETQKAAHGKDGASEQSAPSPDPDYKIPANYRFRNDFLLHYDDSQRLIIARQELQGFRYFQNMLRQIRSSFSPPGFNFAYRDYAGTVINQPVKPQTVQVLFSLDPDGRVRDVRVTASLGQTAVDQACINALAGQNFGPPPPEIFRHGNIFGINFVFPAVFSQ